MDNEQYEMPNFEPQIGYSPPQPAFSDSFSKWQLDGSELITQLEHILRGEKQVKNRETGIKEWVKQEGSESMMNEIGINAISGVLIAVGINKINFLSKLDKDIIYKRLQECVNEITIMLSYHHEAYGIKNPVVASMIVTQITYFLESGLLMASEGGMRDYLRTTTQEIRQFRQGGDEKQKRGGLFGLFGKGGE